MDGFSPGCIHLVRGTRAEAAGGDASLSAGARTARQSDSAWFERGMKDGRGKT